MGVRESKIEKYISKAVKELGGFTEKWGINSNPDMVIFSPAGRIELVEVKTKDGRVSSGQERRIKKIKNTGCPAYLVIDYVAADLYIKELRERVKNANS